MTSTGAIPGITADDADQFESALQSSWSYNSENWLYAPKSPEDCPCVVSGQRARHNKAVINHLVFRKAICPSLQGLVGDAQMVEAKMDRRLL